MPTSAATIRTTARIRREFLDFFADRHAHVVVPSSPVVPHDDPTLLFTNAGMNQFKDVFLGRGRREYSRAVDTQKCIRAGGKHNDLEDVGRDTYHHTFFEMLGNWSFGDYFKQEAIDWAWELLTDVWGVDPDRLYATVFEGSDAEGLAPDEESEAIWRRHLPGDRISRWGKKDNFWEMGETGPCGPCTEIHYDGRSAEERARVPATSLVNGDHGDVIEIWNLVFIQYERGEGGALKSLPAKHVDTGMGLERIARVLQGRESNYDTDLWEPIFTAIRALTGARPYGGSLEDPVDIAYRIIADHVRCLTVAINDGAWPGNEGRGYVLRRILRRAVRFAHQTLGVDGPVICELVPAVVESLGQAFPDLHRKPERIADVLREEEESFLRTLGRGIALFDDAASRAHAASSTTISAEDAFKLHDTYGFPIDLTRVMASEREMLVDEPGYERLMEAAREQSRGGPGAEDRIDLPADAIARLLNLGVEPTHDVDKHHGRPVTTRVRAIWNGVDFDNGASLGHRVAVILGRTNHYAEAGGQIGDRGAIHVDAIDAGTGGRGMTTRASREECRFVVEDTQECGGYVLHVGRVTDGVLRVGDDVQVTLDRGRRESVSANHTATHLLNHALRAEIGDEVDQRGSLVAPDRLRFDFTSAKALTPEQLDAVEARVNAAIERGLPVDAAVVPLERAQRINGVRAVFGERYPDPVRVVSIGATVAAMLDNPDDPAWREASIEFCGGTHLHTTDEARRCVIVQEQALASGVRRILAVTGTAAMAAAAAARDLEARVEDACALEGEAFVEAHEELARLVDVMTLPAGARAGIRARLDGLRDKIRAARRSAQSAVREGAVEQARMIAASADAGAVIVASVDGADADALLPAMDVIRATRSESPIMLFAPDPDEGRVAIAASVPKSIISRGLKAGDWVREAARTCGGGGGGRPDMAQAGGKDPTKVPEAMEQARAIARELLS